MNSNTLLGAGGLDGWSSVIGTGFCWRRQKEKKKERKKKKKRKKPKKGRKERKKNRPPQTTLKIPKDGK